MLTRRSLLGLLLAVVGAQKCGEVSTHPAAIDSGLRRDRTVFWVQQIDGSWEVIDAFPDARLDLYRRALRRALDFDPSPRSSLVTEEHGPLVQARRDWPPTDWAADRNVLTHRTGRL